MTQTQPNKGGPSLGAAAAAAAAGSGAPRSADNKPADNKPADAKPAEGSNGAAAGAAMPDKKKRESKRKVFVVVGTVQEFETIVQAEKYLNGPEAPAGEYTVLQGARSRTSKRVSLR
jgi:hypothetical protein